MTATPLPEAALPPWATLVSKMLLPSLHGKGSRLPSEQKMMGLSPSGQRCPSVALAVFQGRESNECRNARQGRQCCGFPVP